MRLARNGLSPSASPKAGHVWRMIRTTPVLTPIGPEWQAFGQRLADAVTVQESLVPVRIGKLGQQAVVCALAQKGEANAATSLQFVLERWKPRWVMLVGIAGGFAESGISLGNIVLGHAQRAPPTPLQKPSLLGKLKERLLGAWFDHRQRVEADGLIGAIKAAPIFAVKIAASRDRGS
jgi:hypothetical protein